MKIPFLKKKKKKINLKPIKEVRPKRDWIILVSIFLVLLLLVMSINIYILFTFTREIENKTDFIDPTSLNKQKLLQTVEEYDALQEEFDAVSDTFVPVRDPS